MFLSSLDAIASVGLGLFGRGLAFVSSSGQLRSMSGLVDLGIQVYCCEISDFKGTLHLKSTTQFCCQAQAQVSLAS